MNELEADRKSTTTIIGFRTEDLRQTKSKLVVVTKSVVKCSYYEVFWINAFGI